MGKYCNKKELRQQMRIEGLAKELAIALLEQKKIEILKEVDRIGFEIDRINLLIEQKKQSDADERSVATEAK
jgi:nitroimidazol reductase NimA-like FMN-containing flavoprotein (pyridoxamine 5'-phosphate oxidase superfamily)